MPPSTDMYVLIPGTSLNAPIDENGKPLPEQKIYKEEIKASFLISWDNIKTIMHYPNREGYDFPSEFEKNIGFKFKNTKK